MAHPEHAHRPTRRHACLSSVPHIAAEQRDAVAAYLRSLERGLGRAFNWETGLDTAGDESVAWGVLDLVLEGLDCVDTDDEWLAADVCRVLIEAGILTGDE